MQHACCILLCCELIFAHMLQELNNALKGKDEFISAYAPVRSTVEEFLRGGQVNKGLGSEKVMSAITNITHGRKQFPRLEREVTGMLQGAATSVRVKAWTEGFLYTPAREIENSYIMVSVTSDSDPRLGKSPVAVLPPLQAFRKNEIPYERYVDIPRRVSDILSLLGS